MRHRVVGLLALLLVTVDVVDCGLLGQLVAFGRETLRLQSFSLSLLFAGSGIGSVPAAVVATRIGRRFPLATVVIAALPVNAPGALTVAVAPDLVLAMLGMAVLSVSETVIFINLIALRQRILPTRYQGRAMPPRVPSPSRGVRSALRNRPVGPAVGRSAGRLWCLGFPGVAQLGGRCREPAASRGSGKQVAARLLD